MKIFKNTIIKIVTFPVLCMWENEGTHTTYPCGEELVFAVHASKNKNVDVTLLGAIGDDKYGDDIINALDCTKVNFDNVYVYNHTKTALIFNYLIEKDNLFYERDQWWPNALKYYSLSKKEKTIIKNSDVVYTHYNAYTFEDTIKLKKKNNFILAVDIEDRTNYKELEEYMPYCEFVFARGSIKMEWFMQSMSKIYDGVFVITNGTLGAITYYKGRKYCLGPNLSQNNKHPEGFAESYHAAFLIKYLQTGDINKSMLKARTMAEDTLKYYGHFKHKGTVIDKLSLESNKSDNTISRTKTRSNH